MKVEFKQYQCEAVTTKYGHNQNALKLFDLEDGCSVAVASVCLPDEQLENDEIFIKSWSENQGMRKALEDAGIIGPVLEYIPVGWVKASKHKLLINH
jgi:hypothetical protein